MPSKSGPSNHCEWYLERVEPYVDGDLDTAEREKFESHVATCRACAEELALATRVTSTLRALPAMRGPDGAISVRPDWRERVAGWLDLKTGMRPAFAAMLVVIAAVAVFVSTQRREAPPTSSAYSDMQLREARDEALIAFAYIGKYTRRTGRIIQEEVIERRVIAPVRSAVDEQAVEIIELGIFFPVARGLNSDILPATKSEDKRSE